MGGGVLEAKGPAESRTPAPMALVAPAPMPAAPKTTKDACKPRGLRPSSCRFCTPWRRAPRRRSGTATCTRADHVTDGAFIPVLCVSQVAEGDDDAYKNVVENIADTFSSAWITALARKPPCSVVCCSSARRRLEPRTGRCRSREVCG